MKWLKNFIAPRFFKAAVYEEFGKPSEVIKVMSHSIPDELPLDHLLVKMHASSVNPSDLLTIRGIYAHRTYLPKVAGFEGVGTVVADQNDNRDEYIGKRVLALKGIGTWQEYNIIPASEAVIVPEAISNIYAAQLYINPLTVWVMLTQKLQITSGDWLLINAGNSACGYIIASLAKAWNFNLISIVRREEAKIKLQELGVKYIINSSDEDLYLKVQEYIGHPQVDFALDAIGGKIGNDLASLVRPGGKILQYGLMSGQPLQSDFFYTVNLKSINFEFFHLREWVYNIEPSLRASVFQEMIEAFVTLRVQLPNSCKFMLEDINIALEKAEQNERDYKVILTFDCESLVDNPVLLSGEEGII